jgi:hypothetical protein
MGMRWARIAVAALLVGCSKGEPKEAPAVPAPPAPASARSDEARNRILPCTLYKKWKGSIVKEAVFHEEPVGVGPKMKREIEADLNVYGSVWECSSAAKGGLEEWCECDPQDVDVEGTLAREADAGHPIPWPNVRWVRK